MDDRYEEITQTTTANNKNDSKEWSTFIDDKMRMIKIQMVGFPEK